MKRDKYKRVAKRGRKSDMVIVDKGMPDIEPKAAPEPEAPKGRQLIVVDVETTGLDVDTAAILEVAAVNLGTGEKLHFFPHVPPEAWGKAEPKALQVNRYFERGCFDAALSPEGTEDMFVRLRDMLNGNVFAGSNPAFDSALIAKAEIRGPVWFYDELNPPEPRRVGRVWHHRLADLAAFAAGKLDLPLDELPGLDAVAEHLQVPLVDRHSAIADACTTALCFDILRNLHAEQHYFGEKRTA